MSKTPLRITFVGGGTDLPSYYREHGPGAVVSAAIDKYIYVMVHRKFDDKIRLSYSKMEHVEHIDQLEHPTIKAALKLLKIDKGIEIFSIADIPTNEWGGTGLGSSETFLVGLLNALHVWKGETVPPEQLAKEAVHIELDVLKEPVGKQDQYIAAMGGIRLFEFRNNEEVTSREIDLKGERRALLKSHLHLFFTGTERKATSILKDQSAEAKDHIASYDRMREMAYETAKILERGDIKALGKLMHDNWELKKTLNAKISTGDIDRVYAAGLKAGAYGGKLVGAGGGGFMLFVAPPEKASELAKTFPEMKHAKFEFDDSGSTIVFRN